jgi:hypothetical protein
MGKSTAQPLQVSMAGDQTVDIQPVERHSHAQALEVTMSIDYQFVDIKPAQKLPQD